MGDNHQHHLELYLNTILPQIGLDAETYAPYITGILPTPEQHGEQQQQHTSKNEQQQHEQELEEELEQIIELLQASSESHGDDNQVWIDLKSTIRQKDAEYRTELRQIQITEDVRRKEKMEEHTRTELELARVAEEERKMMELRKKEEGDAMGEVDLEKRRILEQYAYDETELYDNDGNLIVSSPDMNGDPSSSGPASSKSNSKGASTSGGGGSSKKAAVVGGGADMSNRAMAQKYAQETTQQARSTQGQTKKEERGKTKNAKLDKIKQKEERRKRAQKGERKR